MHYLAVPFSLRRLGLAAVAASSLALCAGAQVVPVPYKPVVGSSNPATAEPPVLPAVEDQNCIVTLFNNQAFVNYSAQPISYALPPAGCGKDHWSKVVLTIDFTVTAGRQFDRTASLYLGNANIFYGTTAEPRSALSPSWRVERDVTDLSALFKTAQTGQAIIYNIVDNTYTGKIYATAKLHFFKADFQHPPALAPDVVIPVSGSNSPVELDTTSSAITTTVTAPRNTVKAYLDVISQSQSNDEFWYLNAPTGLENTLDTAPGNNTAFRETEITIDGKPAGVAPVYPWIYTGGIDPYLWEPITGVQTLNFKPYRVDLTPFAGVLSDGNPHTVGVSVYNASSYFLAAANLLLYTDPFRQQTGGGLIENTLTPPSPQLVKNLQTDSTGTTAGTVNVGSTRSFVIKGYVNTALGRVETTVEQTVAFNSLQTYNVNNNTGNDHEIVAQTSTVDSKTTSQLGFLKEQTLQHTSFPLQLDYNFFPNADGTYSQIVTSDQKNLEALTHSINGFPLTQSSSAEQVHSNDTLQFSSSFAVTGAGPSTSTASYQSQDSPGKCYSRTITSSNRVLTAITDAKGCPSGR